MKKVCIIGMGYVGLTLGMHAVRNGYDVHGIEILESTFNKISSGKTHFHESGLDELLQLSLGKSFHIHKDIPNNIKFDIFIITVGTPLSEATIKAPNMGILDNSIKSIAPHVTSDSLVILRSTIPVGSSALIERQISKIQQMDFIDISFCPERTAEGKALMELQSLPQIISGNTKSAIKKARNFFEPLTDEIVEVASLEEAELIKLFNNTYRDASFAIANSFNQIAQSFNIDGLSVINNANYNYPRSAIPKPGFVAGPCLEKDAYILSSNMDNGDLKEFILGVRKANENLENLVANKLRDIINSDLNKKTLITGLAFKGIPQTNDLRGSSSVKILEQLSDFSSCITIHDFMNSKAKLNNELNFESIEPEDILSRDKYIFDYIVILNNHPKYKMKQMHSFVEKQIENGALVIDAWNVMELTGQYTLTNLFIKG